MGIENNPIEERKSVSDSETDDDYSGEYQTVFCEFRFLF